MGLIPSFPSKENSSYVWNGWLQMVSALPSSPDSPQNTKWFSFHQFYKEYLIGGYPMGQDLIFHPVKLSLSLMEGLPWNETPRSIRATQENEVEEWTVPLLLRVKRKITLKRGFFFILKKSPQAENKHRWKQVNLELSSLRVIISTYG